MAGKKNLGDILAAARRIRRDRAAAARTGLMIRREHAAQLAEQANIERDHDVETATPDFLDGYAAGFEKSAEIIRRGQIRKVK